MNKSKLAVKVFDNCAVEYNEKFMDVSSYHEPLDLFVRFIKKENAAILDMACGPGNISKHLLTKRPDFNLLGIDLATNMLELAKKNNPSAEYQTMDCRDIHKMKKKFDGIICGFGLPYLSKRNAIKVIKNAGSILNPNGVLYLSTMEDDYKKSSYKTSSSDKSIKVFTYYHQADYLIEALEKNGFQIAYFKRQPYLQKDKNDPIKDLIIIAKKAP